VGSNLQVGVPVQLQYTPGKPVWLVAASSNEGVVVVSGGEGTAGTPSAAVGPVTNTTPKTFWIQGEQVLAPNTQTATVTFCAVDYASTPTAPTSCPTTPSTAFAPTVVTAMVNPSGFVTTTSNFTTSVGAANTTIVVASAVLETTSGLNRYQAMQELRAGVVVPLDLMASPSNSDSRQVCSNGVGSIAVSPLYAQEGVGTIADRFIPTTTAGTSGNCAITVSVNPASQFLFSTPGSGGTYTPIVVATVH
jgi:hypothetical protein